MGRRLSRAGPNWTNRREAASTVSIMLPRMKGVEPMRYSSDPSEVDYEIRGAEDWVDAYFSADVETDGPIPGPFSIL